MVLAVIVSCTRFVLDVVFFVHNAGEVVHRFGDSYAIAAVANDRNGSISAFRSVQY
jgi:hypothetical protein